MRLYYRPRAGRPMRAAWALEELGVPYESVGVSAEECQSAEHLARHPLGRVPALELDDGQVVFESTAIVLTLADLFPDGGLTGPVGSALRNEVYEWSIFAMTELERPLLIARPSATGVEDGFRQQSADASRRAIAALADRLGDGPFLLGETLTAADIVVGGVLAVLERVGLSELLVPSVAEYLARLKARPAFARSLEQTESVPAS
jgi:glutathione S-transferase